MTTIDVVYVEDDDQEALIMRIRMQRYGINIVHVAQLTLETIERLRQPPHDAAAALILDARLRGQSGLELARALRAAGDTRPIALVTAGDNPDPPLVRALNVQFFSKPLDYEALAAALRSSAP